MQRLQAGAPFPEMSVERLGGGTLDLKRPGGDAAKNLDWRAVVIYRGRHCPICTDYLGKLQAQLPEFEKAGVEVVAVSADSAEQAADQIAKVSPAPTYAVGHGLTTAQMETLGLYISDPRSPEETDHPFAEPALFVINGDGNIHIADVSNAPFVRPELDRLASGLQFIRKKDYPIRGTHQSSTH